MNARIAALIVTAAATLALPAGAQAITAGIEDGVLRVTGTSPRDLPVIRQFGGDEVQFVQDFETEPGPGCRRDPDLVCDAGAAIVVTLGAGTDELTLEGTIPVPVRYSGGPGRDTARWPGENGQGARVDNDGRPDDGPAGWDDVEADVEVLQGRPLGDVLGSGRRGASIYPNDGDDTVRGGSGPDRIATAFIETDGVNSEVLYTQGADTVSCGGGQDFVLHDSTDVIARDCEAFGRPTPEDAERYFLFRGSRGDDFMGAPTNWDPARIYAGSGHDRVQGPDRGVNRVELGAGNDRFRGGGSNRVYAQSGNDYVDVQNASTDRVYCGTGRDRVIADTGDRLSSCESVRRISVAPPR